MWFRTVRFIDPVDVKSAVRFASHCPAMVGQEGYRLGEQGDDEGSGS